MIKRVQVSAPGKVILSGEHAVVYGFPAILAAVNRRLTITVEEKNDLEVYSLAGKDLIQFAVGKAAEMFKVSSRPNFKITINSQILLGCGMGSSASMAVALVGALSQSWGFPWNRRKINDIAYEIEKKQHRYPSGGDNTIATYGGFLWFRKETENFKVFIPIKPKDFPTILLINSGKPVENTGEMVAQVRNFFDRDRSRVNGIFQRMEKITRFLLEFLEGKDYPLCDLFQENESLLESLGIVSPKTKRIIQEIGRLGGGAKVSGAGGVKIGSGIILAYHKDIDLLENFAKKENLGYFKVVLGERGVMIEKKQL